MSRTALQEAIDADHKEVISLLIDATKKAEEKVGIYTYML